MVLTDRQRADLHAGIYEYLMSRPGEQFAKVAEALSEADAAVATGDKKPSSIPILEKKWTAVPRLQKKVLELERAVVQAAKNGGMPAAAANVGSRRMLPRAPCSHTLQGHSNTVSTVVVHPIFTIACSGSDDATIKVWDHESGEYIRTLKGHTGAVHCLSFTPTGTHLASSSSDLSMKLWDFKTYTCIRTLTGHDHTISSICFIPSPPPSLSDSTIGNSSSMGRSSGLLDVSAAESAYLVSASRDKTLKVWELETGFCVNTRQDHLDWIRCLAVRPDGQFLASSGSDFNINVYKFKNTGANAKMGEDMVHVGELRGHEHVVESIAFVTKSNAGKNSSANAATKLTAAAKRALEAENYLASGGRDRIVRLWNVLSMSCIAEFAFHENWVRSVIVHPSGNYIISAGDDRSIRVLDIKSNRCLRTLDNAHQHFVASIAMHHTLPILVSGGVDHVVKCWTLD